MSVSAPSSASGAERRGVSAGETGHNINVRQTMETLPEVTKQAKQQMRKAIENTKRELATIRSGRATTSLLDTVKVDAYGQQMPLNQVSSIAAPEAQLLTVQPWDKSLVGTIEKAILTADLGLNPSNDGNIIRVPLPPLNEERRKELVKIVRKLAEEGKIAIRHARTEAIVAAKKVEHVSDDEKHRTEGDIQRLHDDAVEQINSVVEAKEAEIMEV